MLKRTIITWKGVRGCEYVVQVRQREEDSQCSKMMLRFREEKIRRLEGLADNVLSAETFYDEERKNLIDELQLIRGRLDRNPELTRFAMENIRLMEELRRYCVVLSL